MHTRLLTTAAAALLVISSAPQAAGPSWVVHEWGTFTSVQGHDGKQAWWLPHLKTDLPAFVYARGAENGGIKGVKLLGPKESQSAILRMETPVIYFYSDTGRAVDVRVRLPKGKITEWYPQATRIGPSFRLNGQGAALEDSLIEWQGVTILPRDTAEVSAAKLIRTSDGPKADHYYSARATDANLLRVKSPHARAGVEYERDLFYRGLAEFPGPLIATVDSDESQLTLLTEGPEALTSLFVVTIRNGLMRYQKVDSVTPDKTTDVALDAVPFAALDDTRSQLMEDMVKALASQGLYEKEARAMVDTWKHQWFAEEGSRVFYLLPRAWTDRVLPLEVTPKPDQVVRVMVGRAELIMPSIERGLKREIMAFKSGDAAAQEHAVATVRNMNLGRFLAPALQIALGSNGDQATW
ncbi:MAG TPA: hypothetical protein VGO53_10425, partial [Steroidobacteraceae bacterium]|nr:hypothetical protein [Steroidobacteraceae bacterium]